VRKRVQEIATKKVTRESMTFVLWHFQMDKFEGYTQSFMYIVVKMNIF